MKDQLQKSVFDPYFVNLWAIFANTSLKQTNIKQPDYLPNTYREKLD